MHPGEGRAGHRTCALPRRFRGLPPAAAVAIRQQSRADEQPHQRAATALPVPHPQTNDLEEAVKLFAQVLQVWTVHYGGAAAACVQGQQRWKRWLDGRGASRPTGPFTGPTHALRTERHSCAHSGHAGPASAPGPAPPAPTAPTAAGVHGTHPSLPDAELAPECARGYYRYGSALLYQAQDSADVFGAGVRDAADEGEAEAGGWHGGAVCVQPGGAGRGQAGWATEENRCGMPVCE